jgi:S-adenosylmethionine decarboxylase
MTPGCEWVVDAGGCRAEALASRLELESLLASLTEALDLHPAAPAVWREFPDTGGMTAMLLLAESHLTLHTWPEHGYLALNLYCCRPRPAWDFEGELRSRFGACRVRVRLLERCLP